MSNIVPLPPRGPIQGDVPMQGQITEPYCKAHTRSGERCKNRAMLGGVVCRMHGGKAPNTQRKAKLRLLELVDPAIATLAREMTQAANSSDRQRAANSILDRAGISRGESVEGEVARALLLDRLLQLRQGAQS